MVTEAFTLSMHTTAYFMDLYDDDDDDGDSFIMDRTL